MSNSLCNVTRKHARRRVSIFGLLSRDRFGFLNCLLSDRFCHFFCSSRGGSFDDIELIWSDQRLCCPISHEGYETELCRRCDGQFTCFDERHTTIDGDERCCQCQPTDEWQSFSHTDVDHFFVIHNLTPFIVGFIYYNNFYIN